MTLPKPETDGRHNGDAPRRNRKAQAERSIVPARKFSPTTSNRGPCPRRAGVPWGSRDRCRCSACRDCSAGTWHRGRRPSGSGVEGCRGSAQLSARRFDLHHVSAEARHELRGKRHGLHLLEGQDADTGQRPSGPPVRRLSDHIDHIWISCLIERRVIRRSCTSRRPSSTSGVSKRLMVSSTRHRPLERGGHANPRDARRSSEPRPQMASRR